MKNHLRKPKFYLQNNNIINNKIKEEDDAEIENINEYEELIKLLKIQKLSRTKTEQSLINKYLCNNIK